MVFSMRGPVRRGAGDEGRVGGEEDDRGAATRAPALGKCTPRVVGLGSTTGLSCSRCPSMRRSSLSSSSEKATIVAVLTWLPSFSPKREDGLPEVLDMSRSRKRANADPLQREAFALADSTLRCTNVCTMQRTHMRAPTA